MATIGYISTINEEHRAGSCDFIEDFTERDRCCYMLNIKGTKSVKVTPSVVLDQDAVLIDIDFFTES